MRSAGLAAFASRGLQKPTALEDLLRTYFGQNILSLQQWRWRVYGRDEKPCQDIE